MEIIQYFVGLIVFEEKLAIGLKIKRFLNAKDYVGMEF